MDNSHVALVTVELKANEFAHYRCDRNIPLGISVSPKSQAELVWENEADLDTIFAVGQLDQDLEVCKGYRRVDVEGQ